MSAVASFITRKWIAGIFALVAILAAGAVAGTVGQADKGDTTMATLPLDSDSRAAEELSAQLPDVEGSAAVVLFSSDEKFTQDQLGIIQDRARSLPGAVGAPAAIAEDGTAATVFVPVKATNAAAVGDVVDELREAAKADLPDGMVAQVTGPAAIQADLGAVFDGANFRLLAATATVVAFLLIVTYRSPVLWLIPLTVVAVADQLAATVATRVLAAFDVQWDESTIGILSVLVFGAGTNYALLLISRYRDELRFVEDRREAMVRAWKPTSEAVFASASTVVIGLVTLLLSAFPATRGLGLACAVGIVVVALFVMFVLPAALVVFGRWVFWPKVPRTGQSSLADGHSLWRRVGDTAAKRPVAFVIVTLIGLVVAGLGTLQVKTGLDEADQFLQKPEAIAAAERLGESFPAGSADPVVIVSRGSDADTLTSAIESVDGISSTREVASEGGITEVQAVLDARPGTSEAERSVKDIRGAVADLPDTHVGGTEAKALDSSEATGHDQRLIFPLILALVVVALGLLLRSLVAPIILVCTVVATYFASLGISWILFTQFLGFDRLDNTVPLYAFVFLVALGVDYNIFLVTRAAEEARAHGPREGMLRSLAATGGVITSAGILLAAVFAVLGVLPLVVLAQVGVVICVGVLLDTLIVRTVLVPAIALILGDRFWWPRKLRRDAAPAESTQAAHPGAGAEATVGG